MSAIVVPPFKLTNKFGFKSPSSFFFNSGMRIIIAEPLKCFKVARVSIASLRFRRKAHQARLLSAGGRGISD
jgi:hypothetical protein